MDNTIFTVDTVYGDRIRHQPKVNQKNKKSLWGGLGQLAGVICEFVIEVIRSNNAPEPTFSNGRPRVLIRPDRIDLV